MYVLGLSVNHNSATVLVKDNKIVFAAENERFTRKKGYNGICLEAINHALKKEGITIKDVDYIALPWKPFKPGLDLEDVKHNLYFGLFEKLVKSLFRRPTIAVNHHVAHAYSTFPLSGMKNSNVIVMDGRGEKNSSSFFLNKNGVLNTLKIFNKNNSIGFCYQSVSKILGFKRGQEGKTMGLSAYGKKLVDLSNYMTYHNGNLIANHKQLKKDFKQLGFNADLAYSIQKMTERIVKQMLKDVYETTGLKNFCFSGGLFLNCTLNGSLHNEKWVKNVFIQPAANDAGTALGAAVHVAMGKGGFKFKRMEHVYFGPGRWRNEKNVAREVAELLTNDKIIGWFDGRMEFGPRALGNRSILANPMNKETLDRVNKLKGREAWRPLAPTVLADKQEKFLKNSVYSPFMLRAFQVKTNKKREVPAIVHVDGTTRPQTLKKSVNPIFYCLVKSFYKKTGIPMVLNTSFNLKDKPIVMSSKHALKTFIKSELDYLVMNNQVLNKNEAQKLC